MSEQEQTYVEPTDPILGIPLSLVKQWNDWLTPKMTELKAQQANEEQQLLKIMRETTSAQQIPGANYGSQSNKGLTILLVGALGTRKTTWCAQWPKPFFLTIASEGGDDALIPYPRIAVDMLSKSQNNLDPPPVFNVLRPPSVEIKTWADIQKWVPAIAQHHRQWGVATVIIDGLNYLMDMWISEHTAARRKNKTWIESQRAGKVDLMRPPDWGMLDSFLRDMRVILENQKLNVIWTVHEKPVYEADELDMMKRSLVEIRPLIKGAQYITLPGACKMIIRAEKMVLSDNKAPLGRSRATATYWTSPETDMKGIRHKYYDAFPKGKLEDPVFQTDPTFRGLWNQLRSFIYLGP